MAKEKSMRQQKAAAKAGGNRADRRGTKQELAAVVRGQVRPDRWQQRAAMEARTRL